MPSEREKALAAFMASKPARRTKAPSGLARWPQVPEDPRGLNAEVRMHTRIPTVNRTKRPKPEGLPIIVSKTVV